MPKYPQKRHVKWIAPLKKPSKIGIFLLRVFNLNDVRYASVNGFSQRANTHLAHRRE